MHYRDLLKQMADVIPSDTIIFNRLDTADKLLEFITNPAIIINLSDGTIVKTNNAFCKQLNVVFKNMVGHTPVELGLWHSLGIIETGRDDTNERAIKRWLKLNTPDGDIIEFTIKVEFIFCENIKYLLFILGQSANSDILKQLSIPVANLIDQSKQGVCIIRDDQYIYANERLAEILEMTPPEICGYSPSQLTDLLADPYYKNIINYSYDEVTRGNSRLAGVEIVINTPKSSRRWLMLDFKSIEIDNHPALLVLISDITETKLAIEQSKSRETLIRTILDSAQDSIFVKDLNLRYIHVNAQMEKLFGRTADELIGVTDEVLFNLEIIPMIQETDRRVLNGEIIDDEQTKSVNGVNHTFHVVKTPIRNNKGQIIGLCGIARDITEKKRIEQDIIKSEERFRSIIENSNDIIYSCLADGTVTYISPHCQRYGYSPNEIIGQKILNYVHPDDRIRVTGDFQKAVIDDDKFPTEFRLVHKDGGSTYVEEKCDILRDGERVIQLSGVIRDITDRKKIELALSESEERLRELVELAPEVIYEADINGTITFANNTALEKFGYTRSDVENNMNALGIISPKDLERASKNIKKIFAGEKIGSNEYEVVRKDGSKFSVTMHSAPIQKNGKIVGIRGIIVDITQRKLAEEALQASEQFSRAVIEKSPLGVSVRNKNGKLLSCNEAWKKIWGKSEGQLQNYLNEPERGSLQFDKRDDYLALWHEPIREIYKNGGYLYIPEVKLLYRKEGGDRWVSQHFYAIKGSDGEVGRVVVLTEDITDRKRTTEALKQSEAYYRRLFEGAHDAILVIDPDTEVIMDANQRASEIYGFPREEFIGMSLKAISKDIEHGEKQIQRTMGQGYYHSFETVQYRKDGSEMILEVNASVIEYKGLQALLSINRDLTDKRKAEIALRQNEERFRAVINSVPISIFAVNNNGIITLFEGQQDKYSDNFKQNLIGSSIFDIYPHPETQKLFAAALSGELTSHYIEIEGHILELRTSIQHDEEGHCIGLIGTSTDITERRQAEDALAKSEEWIRTIVSESTITMFALDRNGVITFVEGKLVDSPDNLVKMSLIGKSIFNLFIDEPSRYLLDQALAGKLSIYVTEYNGRIFEARFGPQIDKSGRVIGVYGVAIDITDQKHIEQALREGEEKYRLLVENAGQPIFSVRRDGVFLTMNNTAAEYFSGCPKDFIGKNMTDIFPPQIAEIQLYQIRKAIDTGEKVITEQPTIIAKKEVWFITNIQPIRYGNEKPNSALLIANDITQRKRLETRDKAKSQFLDELRKTKTINQSLYIACQAISDAKIFERAIITIHNDNRTITNHAQVGLNENEIKDGLKEKAPDLELSRKMTDARFIIGHSYYIPDANKILEGIKGCLIPEYMTEDIGDDTCYNGNAFFSPLINESDKIFGWLSADMPFGNRKPEYDDVIYIEELMDILGKKIRETRYLELLETERLALQEKNITLREVLAHIEEEKMEIKHQIANEIENNLLPIAKKILRSGGQISNSHYNILLQGLESLVSPSGARHLYSKLSPREIEICNLIKGGANSKDISETLEISLATVQKHRESIRRKLKITNKSVNLTTYLKG